MPPKRKKRFHGLYYHSSPPRVLPMNAQAPVETKKKSADDFSIRLSTIRIWMHEKDIGKLTRVLWAGQGNRLRQQASTNPKVKRFLSAVPYVMNSIKDVHQSVVDNSLETLQATMESNVPPTLITCKDSNGLNVIHKAAGLGHTMMLEYLLSIWPDGANETDMTGKTALHWAASAKNNMRCYTLLTQAGCEEDALDYKMKTPLYYKQKHNEIERSFLTQVPEAPRVSQDIPVDWEALASDDSDDKKKPEIIIPNGRRKSDILGNSVNLLTSRSEANSIENTSEPDLFEGDNVNDDHPEPPLEESESVDVDDVDQPLENGNMSNSEVDISESEALSPPKTPKEIANEEEVKHVEQQPEKQPEEYENVGNTLNDQNYNDENGTVEAEQKESDNIVENGGEEDKDSGNEETNKEECKEDNQTNEESITEDQKNHVEEKNKVEEKCESSDENERNEDVKKNDVENDEEKTDVTDSIKDSDERSNDNEIIEEQTINKEDNHKIESEENPSIENTTESNDKEVDAEDESSSPSTEKTQKEEIQSKENDLEASGSNELSLREMVDSDSQAEAQPKEHQSPEPSLHETTLDRSSPEELQSENTQPERPQSKESRTGSSHSDGSPSKKVQDNSNQSENLQSERPQSKESRTGSSHSYGSPSKKVKDNSNPIHDNHESKNGETDEKHEKKTDEDDDDDDDQDLEIKPIDTTQLQQQPPETDENENNPEFDDKMASDSPTSSMAIEGFVRGDSEDNQVQSESAAYLDDEERYIEAIINSGDMEQLAAIVLNGDGKKILNRKSSKPEIQAFLTNVPAYMDKISRVHEAAKEGTLYQLQAALDRRKFAIAKDENSPCGASPLHVAVLFGHTDIVRYLAGRFPETTSAVDDDGRTALHYAATINDNGHFFNLLSHLGGNPKAIDKLGNTAEFYLNDEQAKDVLTYKQLLKRFGSEELEDEMLSDQGKAENYSQNAIFKTEQGKYLASSLGDPLIKGLTEIADKRPTDPVAYLAGFLQNFIKSRNDHDSNTNRDNDTGDTNSTALANSDAEIIATPNHVNVLDSPDQTEERFSSPESTPKKEDRDEHGQSMLHFACARSHRRNGLLNLIEESQIDVTYRDELYRTARDVSLQANQPGNAKEIDRFVLSLAVVGDTKPFEHMAIAGYDHILDVVDDEGTSIADVAESRGHDKLVEFFNELRNLEASREELHQATRNGDFESIKDITSSRKGKWLIKAKNYYGRNAMHIAVLKEQEETVEYFVNTCPDALKIGDNLERTPLHYAMGTNSVESISRILIRKGAKRTNKDLKGRQPSYYFINKADILRLQEEEDEHQ